VCAALAARAFNRRTVFFQNNGRGLQPVASGEPISDNPNRSTPASAHEAAGAVQHIEHFGAAIDSEITYAMFAARRPSSVLVCYLWLRWSP
jgi:hypothetical protein